MSAWKKFILLLLAPLLGACAPLVKDGQPTVAQTTFALQAGQTVGQSFVARDAGLSGIAVFLAPNAPGSGTLRLHLRDEVASQSDLASATLPIAQVAAPDYYHFEFAPQSNSFNQTYYFFIEIEGADSVKVGSAPGERYLDGALHQNGAPVDAQAAFRLVYEPARVALGLANMIAAWAGILFLSLLIYILPGWLLLNWLLPSAAQMRWVEKFCLASGIGLAFYIVLLLWTDFAGLHLGAWNAWLPLGAGLGILLWRYRAARAPIAPSLWRAWLRSDWVWHDSIFVALVISILGVRLWTVRTLDIPMWGDSYNHAVIAQLIVDNGGLFQSWMPYTPFASFSMQYGFQAATAIFTWISGILIPEALLLVGQILNGCAVFALYPLAVKFAGGNRWAGIGTLLLIGLLSTMPAFYVNWGRYQQMAGQLVLPIALMLLWENLQNRLSLPSILLAALTMVGALLASYRMSVLLVTFIMPWMVFYGASDWGRNLQKWTRPIQILALIALASAIIALPWALRLYGSGFARMVENQAVQESPWLGQTTRALSPIQIILNSHIPWSEIPVYVPVGLQVLCVAGMLWACIRDRKIFLMFGVWAVELSWIHVLTFLRMPGMFLMEDFSILITLYIPTGLLGGWIMGEVVQAAEKRARTAARVLATLGILLLMVWGLYEQFKIAQPTKFELVFKPDLKAMAWIQRNVSLDSRFWIEALPAFGSAVGIDAGLWIPLLANRETTMAPQNPLLYGEVELQPGYRKRVADLVARMEKATPTSPEVIRALCEWDITHVYIGQTHGSSGRPVVRPRFVSDDFSSPAYNLLYHQDRVYIYSFNSQECNSSR